MPTPFAGEEHKSLPADFANLESLRRFCKELQQYQVDSLGSFKHDVGFQHTVGKKKISVSSSATCVLSLVATGNWKASREDTKKLLKELIPKRKSAELDEDNPFTVGWILEAVSAVENSAGRLDPDDLEGIGKKEVILQEEIKKGNGAVSISGYPGSAYLTQLVVRVLRRRQKLTPELERMVRIWAWEELTRQLALVQAKAKTQDAFAFAYLLILVTTVTSLQEVSPERAAIQRAALKIVFDAQLPDGTWPLSRPLFHYPGIGNAHCYEYEMLVQLLQEPELEDLLLDHLQNLGLAAQSLMNTVYRLEKGIWAWASGHHPQLPGPESWTTASVYHFIHRLDRLLAEAVRRDLFRHLDQPLPRTLKVENKVKETFAPPSDFLDSRLDLPGRASQSLREFLWEKFVEPLSKESDGIIEGRTFAKGTPTSAIFFGPPGTSKTDLAKKVADFLGWPLLTVEPSLLLRRGMDGIQAESHTLFRMLQETERVVVLFDEFDELVRERGSSDSQPFSRLLTTAMLPKLANIHKRASLVFIIATNHVGEFDLAIRRRGRFDRVVQVMPPIYEAKMAKSNWGPDKNLDLRELLDGLKIELTDQVKTHIADLTYDECDSVVIELSKAQNLHEATTSLTEAWTHCTLQTPVSQGDEKETWADRCKSEASLSH